MKNFFILLFILCIPSVQAQTFRFTGKIQDEKNTPLPYTSIATQDLEYGTLADEEGNFVLLLPAGRYEFVLRYLGYAEKRDSIVLEKDFQKNYSLSPESLTLEDVIITEDGRDPAYGIIQKAIDNKTKNATPFETLQHQAYTKTVIGFPKSFSMDSLGGMDIGISFGKKKETDKKEAADPMMKSKILYLSENLSEVFILGREKVKEKIISSRVSGQSQEFSLFGNMISRFDPYQDKIVMESMAPRGVISPIADNAMFYYDYKLLGTIKDASGKYYKIQLIPKRMYDPIFYGTIYINDSSFSIREVDYTTTKLQRLESMDTLRLRQQYMSIEKKWVPVSTKMGFAFNFEMGEVKLPLQGFSLSIASDFKPNAIIEKEVPKDAIVVTDSAAKTTRLFWETIRPIPLTAEEAYDYRLKDSLEMMQHSPAYLDSMSRSTHKVNPFMLVMTGHTFRDYNKNTSFHIGSLLYAVGFNPMEGGTISPRLVWTKKWENKHKLKLAFTPRYGFADKQFKYLGEVSWWGNAKINEVIKLSGGDYVSQFSTPMQIDPYIDLASSLWYKKNYMRLYRKQFAELSYSRDYFDGFEATISTKYEQRSGMNNLSEYSWAKTDANYTPNLSLQAHTAWVSELAFSYRPFSQYISTPNGRKSMGSKWPMIKGTYSRAIALKTGDADWSRLSIGISDDTRLGMLGTSSWRVTAGQFLHTKQVYLPDYFHFQGNETAVHVGGFDNFYLMPYYYFSATKPFLEAHWEHSFSGFLTNKIPGVRKWQINEYVGLHLLKQQNTNPWLELNVGFEKKIFKVLPLRVDLNVRLLGDNVGRNVYYKLITRELEGISIGGEE